jgi:hypothetical protein
MPSLLPCLIRVCMLPLLPLHNISGPTSILIRELVYSQWITDAVNKEDGGKPVDASGASALRPSFPPYLVPKHSVNRSRFTIRRTTASRSITLHLSQGGRLLRHTRYERRDARVGPLRRLTLSRFAPTAFHFAWPVSSNSTNLNLFAFSRRCRISKVATSTVLDLHATFAQ